MTHKMDYVFVFLFITIVSVLHMKSLNASCCNHQRTNIGVLTHVEYRQIYHLCLCMSVRDTHIYMLVLTPLTYNGAT